MENHEEGIREEWKKAVNDKTSFMTDVYKETADWWFDKFKVLLSEERQRVIKLVEEQIEMMSENTPKDYQGGYLYAAECIRQKLLNQNKE